MQHQKTLKIIVLLLTIKKPDKKIPYNRILFLFNSRKYKLFYGDRKHIKVAWGMRRHRVKRNYKGDRETFKDDGYG